MCKYPYNIIRYRNITSLGNITDLHNITRSRILLYWLRSYLTAGMWATRRGDMPHNLFDILKIADWKSTVSVEIHNNSLLSSGTWGGVLFDLIQT